MQRESIVSDFTQAGGALAAVDANWIISTDLQKQSGTATADIQYVANNVIEFQDALGLKASAVRTTHSLFLYGIYEPKKIV
jgi:hypothetical protein